MSWLVVPVRHRWPQALGAGDIDRLWALWMWMAEEVLLALLCLESDLGVIDPVTPLPRHRL